MDINFNKDVANEEIEYSHTDIYIDGYNVAQCEYKVLFINDDMSTNDVFQE